MQFSSRSQVARRRRACVHPWQDDHGKEHTKTTRQRPVHPGEILKHEVLVEMGISAGKLAKHIHVPRTRIERLCEEKTSMTIDTAMRLSRALGSTPEFWMNLQMTYDLLTRARGDEPNKQPDIGLLDKRRGGKLVFKRGK